MENQNVIPEQYKVEYEQICEHYRQGVRSVFDVSKMYFIFQAGLATALGFVISHNELKFVPPLLPFRVNALMFIISAIGFLGGFGAWIIARTFFRYHNANMDRALELESMYGMKSMTKIQGEWHHHRIVGAANFALLLFIVIAAAWIVFTVYSFIPPFV